VQIGVRRESEQQVRQNRPTARANRSAKGIRTTSQLAIGVLKPEDWIGLDWESVTVVKHLNNHRVSQRAHTQ
jgi:hypothetical protein